jgi:hypothetical protein
VSPAAVQFTHPLLDRVNPGLSLSEGIVLEKKFEKTDKFVTQRDGGTRGLGPDMLVEVAVAAVRELFGAQAVALSQWNDQQPCRWTEVTFTLNTYLRPLANNAVQIELFSQRDTERTVYATAQAQVIAADAASLAAFDQAELQARHPIALGENGVRTNTSRQSFLFACKPGASFKKDAVRVSNLPTTFPFVGAEIVPSLGDQPATEWASVEAIESYSTAFSTCRFGSPPPCPKRPPRRKAT